MSEWRRASSDSYARKFSVPDFSEKSEERGVTMGSVVMNLLAFGIIANIYGGALYAILRVTEIGSLSYRDTLIIGGAFFVVRLVDSTLNRNRGRA